MTPRVYIAAGIANTPLDLYVLFGAAATSGSIAMPNTADGYRIQNVDFTAYAVKQIVNGAVVTTVTAGLTVYDALQTGGLWGSGGNAHFQIPASWMVLAGGVAFTVQITLTLTDGSLCPCIVDVTVDPGLL